MSLTDSRLTRTVAPPTRRRVDARSRARTAVTTARRGRRLVAPVVWWTRRLRAAGARPSRPRPRGSRARSPAGVLVVARRDGGLGARARVRLGRSGWSRGDPVLLLVASVPFLFGARSYDVDLRSRTSASSPATSVAGEIVVPTTGARIALPGRIDVPVGDGLVEFGVPLLRPAHTVAQLLDIPALAPRHHRGRPGDDGAQRPHRAAPARARLRRRAPALRAPAHGRDPVHQRRARSATSRAARQAPRRLRHVVPRHPRVRRRATRAGRSTGSRPRRPGSSWCASTRRPAARAWPSCSPRRGRVRRRRRVRARRRAARHRSALRAVRDAPRCRRS